MAPLRLQSRCQAIAGGASTIAAAAMLLAGCQKDSLMAPTGPDFGRAMHSELRTAQDSAEYLRWESMHPSVVTSVTTAATQIPLNLGDSVFIMVISSDCVGDPEKVWIGGSIHDPNGIPFIQEPCPVTFGDRPPMGPATESSPIWFFASAPPGFPDYGPDGEVTPNGDRLYEVRLDDAYQYIDHNDVVLSVLIKCARTGDPVLDNPDFPSRYDSLMKLSKVADTVRINRREWGMLYRNDPLSPTGVSIDWPTITSNSPCYVDFGQVYPFPANVAGTIHDHLWKEHELNPCGTEKTKDQPFRPRDNGGAGDNDWELPGASGGYVFTPDYVFRLPKGVPRGNARRLNPYQWKKSRNGCLARATPPTP
jgi:hypothetical protein